jgi:hypothetical protein
MCALSVNVARADERKAVEPPEAVLKAVYLERFTRFVDWPRAAGLEESESPFRLCTIGVTPFGSALRQIYAKQPIRGKRVEVRSLRAETDAPGCHLLFVGQLGGEELGRLFEAVRDKPILTVGNRREVWDRGVQINMEVVDKKVRFDINEGTARTAGLRISHLLLRYARSVR